MIMYRAISICAVVVTVCWVSPVYALFGPVNLTEKYCGDDYVRSTVVYVDAKQDISVTDASDWRWRHMIVNNLMSSLSPHEPVSVVALDTGAGVAKKVWSTCFPGAWPAETKGHNSVVDFFMGSKEEELDKDRKLFRKRLVAYLSSIFVDKYRDEYLTKNDGRQLIRALLSDTSRYSRADSTVRLIIYSPLVVESNLVDYRKSGLAARGRAVASKLHAEFNNAVVYAFGVGKGYGAEAVKEAKTFFAAFVDSSDGVLMDLAQNLSVPSTAPAAAYNYHVRARVPDGGGDARVVKGQLHLLVSNDGKVVDSYVAFPGYSRATSAFSDGVFHCRDKGCELRVKLKPHDRNVAFFTAENVGELQVSLQMRGSKAELKGYLGVTNAYLDLKKSDDAAKLSKADQAIEIQAVRYSANK